MDGTNTALLALVDVRAALDESALGASDLRIARHTTQRLFEIVHGQGVASAELKPHWETLQRFAAIVPAVCKLQPLLKCA